MLFDAFQSNPLEKYDTIHYSADLMSEHIILNKQIKSQLKYSLYNALGRPSCYLIQYFNFNSY